MSKLIAFSKTDYLRWRKTKEKSWSEESIELNHEKTLITSNLINLKKFMSDGVVLKLIENKVVVSPDPPALPDDNASLLGEGEIGMLYKKGDSTLKLNVHIEYSIC